MNGDESERTCPSVKNQQPSPLSRSPRSTQAFLANQTLEIHRRMPPLLLPSHGPSSLVAEGNGSVVEGTIVSKVEGGKGGGGSERGSPIEKYMRPSKPSSYSPPGSPIEKYQYPLFSLPLPLTLSPDLTPESDWLRFWTKYKMAAASAVPAGISGISSPASIGNNAHYLGAMVTPVRHHQQSYTVPYCTSPYSPLPPPPAPLHYPPPLHSQTSSSSSSLENDAPLDLAIRQREAGAPKPQVASNGAERRRQESPVTERLRESWKEEKEVEERADEGGSWNEEAGNRLTRRPTADAATQDDLANRCIHCGIYFLDEVMYALHMSCHGEQGPYQCSFCLHVCVDRYDFTTHIQRGLHRYADKTTPTAAHASDGLPGDVTMAPHTVTPEAGEDGDRCKASAASHDDQGRDTKVSGANGDMEGRRETPTGEETVSDSSADTTETADVAADPSNLKENSECN